MDHVNWIVIAIIVFFAVTGRIGKITKSVQNAQGRAQAAQIAYTQQLQAAAQAAAPAPPAPPPQPRPMINVTPTGVPQRTVQARMPGPRPAPAPPNPVPPPAAAAPAGSTQAFFHAAFRDPAHAQRAIILAEVLGPPPALR
jgi:hypothetical protein